MKTITYAPDAMRLLNGIFCVFKPSGVPIGRVRAILKSSLSRGLNNMETRSPESLVKIEGSLTSGKPLSVRMLQNYADNPLVVGPRYQPQDIRLKWITHLGRYTSGVLAVAVNDGFWKINPIHHANLLRKVEIKGQFGLATDTFMHDGKVLEKATYGHITQSTLDKMLASVQASHQADSFVYSGIDVGSQAAYEAASKGIVRPHGKSPPIIYSIRCTEFDLPHFIIELMCINETEEFLAEMIHQIGIYLRSCAVCCQLRQLQYGPFTLDHALLRKHWTVEHILTNIILCKNLAEMNQIIPSSGYFSHTSKTEIQKDIFDMQKQKRESNLQ